MRHLLAALLCLSPTLAAAQQQAQCGARDEVLAVLAERYGESRRSIGMTAQGQVVETFANADSGSWTITVTFADGRMCLVASGMAFEAHAADAEPQGDPA
jgi:hypothetical protein